MRFFGFDVTRRKAAQSLMSVADTSRGWVTIHDSNPQSFQLDIDVNISPERALANWAVFACQTLIASDLGKLSPLLMQWSPTERIYNEVDSNAVSPVLRKPNGYQTWPKFIQSWSLSKTSRGNAYMLKEREGRNVVRALHVLDPDRVTPLISDSGRVFYRLNEDRLAGIDVGQIVVPASEIIHDRMWCLFHPLVGLPPLFASWLAATQGLNMQTAQSRFFKNSAVPSGILMTPQRIDDDLAAKYQARWEQNYAGEKRGRTAVLGNGLEYKQITQNAVDSQLVEQLNLTAIMVCSTHHVPPFKIGIGDIPNGATAESLQQIYADDCLHSQIKDIEASCDDGLELVQKGYNLQLDVNDLLRMDSMTQIEFAAKGVERAIFSPDEARRRFNQPPVPGGKYPLAQQQNYSLAALAKRDAKPDPFASTNPAPAATPAPAANDPQAEQDAAAKGITDALIARFNRAAVVEHG